MNMRVEGAPVTGAIIHQERLSQAVEGQSRSARGGPEEERTMPPPAKTADDRVRQAVARVFARRERHRRRPLPVRVAVAVAGFLLLAFGIVALVLPDVGLPAVVAGLALLALEFDWAARLFAVAVLLVERIRRGFVSLPTVVRVAAIAIPVLIVMAVVLVLLRVLPI